MFFHDLKSSLNTRWVLQLYKEFDCICYQYRIKLKKPIIIVDNLKNQWGTWNSQSKMISISQELIETYSWDIVIGILKHEMAHQIVTEFFMSSDLHGQDFLRACELIGVPQEFCKASLRFKETGLNWRQEKHVNEDEVILRKLEKLLSLAQSANEHEAFLAMEKVHELYSKYNIQRIQQGLKSDFYSLLVNFKKKKIPSLHSSIVSILQNHYFVQVIYSDLYDALTDEVHKTIDILGTKQNVLMAEYVFYFLIRQIDSLWRNYKKEKKISARYKISYMQGLVTGFHEKLDKMKVQKLKENQDLEKKSANMGALLKLEDIKLAEFTKRKFPRTSQRSSLSRTVSREHYDVGKKDGIKIVLSKGIQSSSHGERKYLGN